MTIKLDHALAHAALGRPVVALHAVERGGCTCGKTTCTTPGKHPRWHHELQPDGHRSGTTDPDLIRRRWALWPDANIGGPAVLVRDGETRRLVVLDVDRRHDGDATLAAWEAEHGALPATWTTTTGNGEHYAFLLPPGADLAQRELGPGIDTRVGWKGYTVLPGSDHASGRRYAWDAAGDPEDTPLAAAPPALLAALAAAAEAEADLEVGDDDPPVRLDAAGLDWWTGARRVEKKDGATDRSATLFALGCRLAKAGASARGITDALTDRDRALGYEKYTGRRDAAKQYRAIAVEVIRKVSKEGGEAGTPSGARLAELERENAEQAVALERCRAEGARKDALIAGLEADKAALELCLAHPDQTVGGSLPDLATAVQAAYAQGKVLTIDGRDFARCVVDEKAAAYRSVATNNRAKQRVGAARPDITHIREEQIETARYKGPTPIYHFHIPPEDRRSRAAIIGHLAPPPPEQKRHGGRRIPVPPEVAAQDAPVRRERRQVQRFFSLVDERPLGTIESPRPVVDFFAADGTAITAAEAEAFRVKVGARPPAPPRYRPPAPSAQVARKERTTLSAQVARRGAPTAPLVEEPPVQDARGPEPAPFVNQGCRIAPCGTPPTRGGYCARHHPDAWGDALDLRERAPTPLHPRQGRPKCMNRECGARMPEDDRALYCPTCRRDG